MAFDVSPANFWNEIREAEEIRDDFLGVDYEDKISRYAGPGYRRQWKRSEVDFENFSYEWISIFLPLMASGNPRVKARTPRLGYAQALAKAIQLGVNRNFYLTNIKATIEKLAVDWAFKYCACITTPEPSPGFSEQDDPPHRPVTKRISPARYIVDFAAIEHSDVRFQGHMFLRDKDDILKEAEENPWMGWDVDAILSLPEDRRYDEYRRKRDINVIRGEVEYYQIWVPEVRLDTYTDANGKTFEPTAEKGFHGTIFTLPRSAGGGHDKAPDSYIRAPFPYFGPREGPYTFGGYLIVPDEVMPLSPIGAVEAQVEELNNMRQAISAAIEAHKRGVAVDSMAGPDVAEKIKEFEDLWVFTMDNVDNVRNHVAQIELAGVTPLHLQHYQLLGQTLDRVSGMSDAQRGLVSGVGTATEQAIAQQSSGQRMGYMTEKFLGTIQEIAQKEAWYLARHPSSRIALGDEARGVFTDPETGEPIEEPIYLQGSDDDVDVLEETDIVVEPLSMRYTSEALEAERAAKVDALLLNVAPLIPQMPFVDWETYFTRKGEEIGDPTIGKLIDMEAARQLGAIMLQAQIQGGKGTSQPQPRLGVDISPRLKAAESPQKFAGNARPQMNKGPRSAGEGPSTKNAISPVNAPVA